MSYTVNIPEADGPMGARDSRGVPYVVLTDGGIKPEGALFPGTPHQTPQQAWRAFQAALDSYLKQQRASLIEWRLRPALMSPDESGVRIYSRLSII